MSKYIEIELYIETFETLVEDLNNIGYQELSPIEERVEEVELLLDDYVSKVKKTPSPYYSSLLANYLLADDLKDPTPYKNKHKEYTLSSSYNSLETNRYEHISTTSLLDFLYSKYALKLDSLYRKSTDDMGKY